MQRSVYQVYLHRKQARRQDRTSVISASIIAASSSSDSEWIPGPDFDLCHNKRSAIDFASSGALPHVPFNDASRCLRKNGEECSKCRDDCPVEGAIVYEDVARVMDRRVGAIVVATGASQLECN